jgi:serine/threonine-protein kinase
VGRSQQLPAKIGPYVIQGELGRGMMGSVYKAVDPHRDRPVALKVIDLSFPVTDAERALFERRFLAEGEIVSRLSHEGIVKVYEVGRDEQSGLPYLALEFLVGRTLEERLLSGDALDWKEALPVVARVATALHYAHGRGVVHRDIKPANIMVLSNGRPKVMDFGLARLEVGFGLTTTGQIVGTPLYMSPEQTFGRDLDGRSDLFSLGSLAYTLLTRRPAFEAEAVPLILNRIAYVEPAPVSALVHGLPPALDYVLARAMAKRPEDRYPDGDTLAEDIEDVLKKRRPRHQDGWRPQSQTGGGTVVSSTSPEAGPAPVGGETVDLRLRRASGRRRWGLLAVSLGALAAALAGSDFWRPRLRALADPERRPAAQSELGELLAAAADQARARLVPAVEEARRRFNVAPAQPPAEPSSPREPAGDEAELVSEESVAWEQHVGRRSQAGRLSVSIETALEGSSVSVWMDGILAFRAHVRPGPEKRQLVFRTAERGYLGVLPVPPGEREIRVDVDATGKLRSGSLAERFDPGQSRHLDVDRLPDGELSLAWHAARVTSAPSKGEGGR